MIVRQPNGKYCVFSGDSDTVTCGDATREQLIKFLIEERVKGLEYSTAYEVDRVIRKLDAGKLPYFQFTVSYKQMLERIEENSGSLALAEAKKLMGED